MFNSGEEYKNRIKFLDLLETTQPPILDVDDRFSTMLRNNNTYYVPLGQRRTGWAASKAGIFCPIRVRHAPETGNLVSPGAYRRATIAQSAESFRRQSVRAASISSRNASPDSRRGRSISPCRVLRARTETPTERRTMQSTPEMIKRVMGADRRHTIREGTVKRIAKLPSERLDQEGLVSNFVRKMNQKRIDERRRRSVQSDMPVAGAPTRLAPPERPPPLSLSTNRVVLLSSPHVGATHDLVVTNTASVALHITCEPVAAETLPIVLAREREHGAPSAEFSPRKGHGGSVARPSPFFLQEKEAWVLPNSTRTLRITFCAPEAGSYVQQWCMRVSQEAELEPQYIHLSGRAIEPDATSLARSHLGAELTNRQLLSTVRSILVDNVVGPAAEAGAARVAAGAAGRAAAAAGGYVRPRPT